jgi:hypothetical protein
LELIDPADLTSPIDKARRSYLVDEYLKKYILESDPTVGGFVRDPRHLIEVLESSRSESLNSTPVGTTKLSSPFDYLSCELIGDDFRLLHALYSHEFPGYDDLLQKSNTILTGPRGCGKTTILRNLTLKAQLLSGEKAIADVDDFIGVYYNCVDLYFPFQYLRNRASETDRKILVHYFNLALLREVLDTLLVASQKPAGALDSEATLGLQRFLQKWLQSYSFAPKGTPILTHLLSVVEAEKHKVSTWLQQLRRDDSVPDPLLPPTFIPELCAVLCSLVPWMRGRQVWFFLDDYSLPRISEPMQETLHDCILSRWPYCLFKISTESITTIYPYDRSGKLLEDIREYNVVDLGAHFFTAPKRRVQFLSSVINNRLQRSRSIDGTYHDISKVLGMSQFTTYNDLARAIREGGKVHYAGFDLLADLFSGDIAHMLHLVHSIFLATGPLDRFAGPNCEMPIPRSQQNYAIRDYAGVFLSRIGNAPQTGARLSAIVQAFGSAAHWLLLNRESKNVDYCPPWQTFRVVVRNNFSFDQIEYFRPAYISTVPEKRRGTHTIEQFAAECKRLYDDLLKYGVFLRDDRGKTFRGAVVPRLYLRRLLIPKFNLTPSQRDSVSLEIEDFIMFLADPDKLLPVVRGRDISEDPPQERLFE